MVVQYCHSTMFIVGIISSTLNTLLFSRRQLRTNSCCIYFLGSSVNALILLSIGIIPQLYNLYNSPNPFTTIQSFCKTRLYFNQTSAMSCRWLLVMACVDRCLSCSKNANIRRFSSVIMARKIVLIIIGIWLILPIHALIFSNIQPPGNIACSMTNDIVAIYHSFYTIIMGGALPTIISFISSLFIWKNIQKKRQCRIVIINNGRNKRNNIRRQQISFMLLIQVAIFILSTIPFMSFLIYEALTRSITNKPADRKAIEALCKTLTELLVYLITISFYTNTLVSRTFRKELIALFILIISYGHRKYRPRVSPLNITVSNINTMQMMPIMTRRKTSMPKIS